MSIDGIGAMLGSSAPQVTKLGEKPDKPLSPAEVAKARAEAASARQKADLDAVREKGLYAWAQEKKFEALKEKIEKEMKAQKGLDEGTLSAMSPEERAAVMSSLEAEIAKRVQEVMRDSLTEEAKKAAKEGRPAQPMIIDVAV